MVAAFTDQQLRQFINRLGPGMRVAEDRLLQNLRQGAGTRAAVDIVLLDRQAVVYKNYAAAAPGFGRLLGPLLVWREGRSLQRLQNLAGTPKYLIRVGQRGLLMEKIAAVPVLKVNRDIDWSDFFQRYRVLLDSMHAQGVAHGDLRSPHNTLVDAEGVPYIVDFVASVQRGRFWNLPANWLFKQMVLVDRSAIVKLKKRLAPELLETEELAVLEHSSRLGYWARWLGQGVRQLSRRFFTDSK